MRLARSGSTSTGLSFTAGGGCREQRHALPAVSLDSLYRGSGALGGHRNLPLGGVVRGFCRVPTV